MSPLYRQRGLTFVELLVAGALSGLIGVILVQLLGVQSRSAQLQTGLVGVYENAQFGLTFIKEELERAGFNGELALEPVSPVVVHASSDGHFFDQITVQRRLSSSGDQLCTGAAFEPDLTLTDAERVVWSQILVQEDTNRPDHYQLVCRYFFPGRLAELSETWVPPVEGRGILVDGVASFQVLYGVRPLMGGADSGIESYVNFNQWQPSEQEVVAIKLGVLLAAQDAPRLRSEGVLDPQPTYQVLDQVYSVQGHEEQGHEEQGGQSDQDGWDDGVLRRSYESLVHLPNVGRRWAL